MSDEVEYKPITGNIHIDICKLTNRMPYHPLFIEAFADWLRDKEIKKKTAKQLVERLSDHPCYLSDWNDMRRVINRSMKKAQRIRESHTNLLYKEVCERYQYKIDIVIVPDDELHDGLRI